MSDEYTYNILRIVVAQICQTIGWHSIQTTPLELLIDILHKYLQELAKASSRYAQLGGRTEPNLDDIALVFRDHGIQIPDIEEYVNYVDSVGCVVDVPKYPVHKESSLNFLKPGSREVLTRPVHINEYFPPIYPEREVVESDAQQSDIETTSDNVTHNNESGFFKKPEVSENLGLKKSRFALEEEGRPTREISSVMMTSSGFISPAREGKLPDSKPPVLPEFKSVPKSPPPAPIPALPVGNMEGKFEKKIKRKSGTVGDKERKREKQNVSTGSASKIINGTNYGTQNSDKPKMLTKKQKNKQKHKEHFTNNTPNRSVSNTSAISEFSKGSKSDLSTTNKTESFTVPPLPPPSNVPSENDSKSRIDKLSSEPDKQKLNIFKKISASKKDRDDLSKSPSIYPDNQIFSSIPEGTTITPAPPLMKAQGQQKDGIICIDGGSNTSLPKTSSNYSKLSQQANIISQNLEALGTTTTITTKSQTTRKPRKRTHHQMEQSVPLNLSNSSSFNIKKDAVQNLKFPYNDSPNKTSKGKKERKKPKQKETKNMNPLQNLLPSGSENNSRENPFLVNKDKCSLTQKLGKIEQTSKQSPPSPYLAGNFPQIPTIPMFPFYPFPPRPGLIPSTGLFAPIQPMADNSPFKPYLPMMRFDMSNVNKRSRMGSKFDDESPLPPLPPIETEKGYCNVAPLVPDSMKFQLSPTYPSSSNQKNTPGTSYEGFNPANSSHSHASEQSTGMQQKSLKFSDAPIEISDDEKPKSDIDEKGGKHSTKRTADNATVSKASAGSSYSDYPDFVKKEEKNDFLSAVTERGEKHEKRKDKEHKKGKKYKDGKIKKKKDKKDKSKNKEKTSKRKYREEKKDKDKTKKLKKEKKKEKMRALVYSSDDGKQLNDSGDCVSVPKITLKLGLNNSPQHSHSSDERKQLSKGERRESSPELARISPLVTRPPKQKNLKDKNSDSEQCSTISSASANLPPPPTPQITRGPGRPPKSSQAATSTSASNHHHSTSSNLVTSTSSGTGSALASTSSGSQSDALSISTNKSVHSTDAEGNEVWICPACGRVDDGTPMIGCDGCDAWYHWVCVGIQVPPDANEDWYCRVCIAKKQEAHGSDKKRKRKKKNKTN